MEQYRKRVGKKWAILEREGGKRKVLSKGTWALVRADLLPLNVKSARFNGSKCQN